VICNPCRRACTVGADKGRCRRTLVGQMSQFDGQAAPYSRHCPDYCRQE